MAFFMLDPAPAGEESPALGDMGEQAFFMLQSCASAVTSPGEQLHIPATRQHFSVLD